jgi:hypothetical protein
MNTRSVAMRRDSPYARGNRLASRLARSFAATVSVLLLILGGVYAFVAYTTQRDEIARLQQSLAEKAALTISAYLKELRVSLLSAGKRSGVLRFDEIAKMAFLGSIEQQSLAFEQLTLFDRQGSLLAQLTPDQTSYRAVVEGLEQANALRHTSQKHFYISSLYAPAGCVGYFAHPRAGRCFGLSDDRL